LVRPRGGDFVYSERELAVMRHDIEAAKALGAAGAVLGVLTKDGVVDRDQTAALVALARPMTVTFHKAIDQTERPLDALDALLAIGVERVLTSGGRPTALEGAATLKALVDRGGDRIVVMAGGRLDAGSIATVVRESQVVEVHCGSAVTRAVTGPDTRRARDGADTSWGRVDAQRVAAIVAMLQGEGDRR
jgi:copper homeostasis protein